MKAKWHFIKGSPKKMWALYKSEKQTGHQFDSFDSDLLGFIERADDGSWNCFRPQWVGNQPNKLDAAKWVQKQIIDYPW